MGFIWTFLAPKVFFSPAIISSAFYILQFQSLPSHRPHHLPSSTTLAFCLTATPVAVYLPDGPVDCYSSALGCTFIYGSGASLVLGKPLIPRTGFFAFNAALNCFLGLFVAFLEHNMGVAACRT